MITGCDKMFARKLKDPIWLQILRLLLRLTCLAFLMLYIFFFVGEGDFDFFNGPLCSKTLCLLFVPGLFTVAFIVTFFQERFSGFLMIFSVLLYNLTHWISNKAFNWPPQYLSLVFIGIGFIFLSVLSRRYSYYSNYYHNRYLWLLSVLFNFFYNWVMSSSLAPKYSSVSEIIAMRKRWLSSKP